jgi:hypothetical protein
VSVEVEREREKNMERFGDRKSEGEIGNRKAGSISIFLSIWLSIGEVMTGQSRRISHIDRSSIPVTALFSSSEKLYS